MVESYPPPPALPALSAVLLVLALLMGGLILLRRVRTRASGRNWVLLDGSNVDIDPRSSFHAHEEAAVAA